MIYPTILIFAADHRTNVEWKLPFIRITDNTESSINFCNDKVLYENRDALSEVSRMIYAYKHINDFGNPDYVGFCHYRRFFANLNTNTPWYETTDKKYLNFIYSPYDLLVLIKLNNVDGIIEYDFGEIYLPATNINDWFKLLNKKLNYLQIPDELIDVAIKYFYNNVDDEFKPYLIKAYNILQIYHQNIFTVNRNVLDIIMKPVCKTVELLLLFEKQQKYDKTTYSKRWLGYITEYLMTNVLFHALELSNKYKFIKQKFLVIK